MTNSEAAVLIQKHWRGYFIRKILKIYVEMMENGQLNEIL